MTDPIHGVAYLDANVFILAVEGTSDDAKPARKLIHFVRQSPSKTIVTSEITLAELLAPTKRADALPLHIKRRAYLDLLLWSGSINLIPVSRDILIHTAELRALNPLKLPDAIHLASAIETRCQFLVTSDSDFNHLPDGMHRLTCTERDVDRLIECLRDEHR